MSVIDIAKSHFENLGTQSIEVPEWKDEDGKPTVLYWNPITLSEKNKLLRKSDNLNDVSLLADVLLMKALDEDGNKVFKAEEKLELKDNASWLCDDLQTERAFLKEPDAEQE